MIFFLLACSIVDLLFVHLPPPCLQFHQSTCFFIKPHVSRSLLVVIGSCDYDENGYYCCFCFLSFFSAPSNSLVRIIPITFLLRVRMRVVVDVVLDVAAAVLVDVLILLHPPLLAVVVMLRSI